MDDIAIKVENVYKDFLLPQERVNSVKGIVTGLSKGSPWRIKKTQHALKDISLEIKKGEFFGIVGRNGSGKSTLLKILAGIYQPTKGQVQVHGRLVPFIELGVGFNQELTGRDNVYLNGAMLGFSVKEIDAMYSAIVEFAEIERFMDQKLKNYSSGMQVRLAFSMAIRADADILLIDEVLAVGDADFQRKCFDYFRSLKKNKKTVVFVSHDMNAVREYCDRAIMIEKSRIVASGDPESVAVKYTKMFMEKDSTRTTQENSSQRWGDKALQYTSIEFSPESLRGEKTLKLITKARVNESVGSPIFGFVIKNAAGQHILGTNTRVEHYKLPDVIKGEELTIEWDIPHIFGDGQYLVDVAIVRDDGITECDWWEDAGLFMVYKEERTPYIVKPDVTIKSEVIEKNKV